LQGFAREAVKERLYRLHLVVGVLCVPHGDEVFAGLANIGTVEDRAAEGTGHIHAIAQGGVGTEGDSEGAFEVDVG